MRAGERGEAKLLDKGSDGGSADLPEQAGLRAPRIHALHLVLDRDDASPVHYTWWTSRSCHGSSRASCLRAPPVVCGYFPDG